MSCPDVLTTVYGKAPTLSPGAGAFDDEAGTCAWEWDDDDGCSCDVMVDVQ